MPISEVRQGRFYIVLALLLIKLLDNILTVKSLNFSLALLITIYTFQVIITNNLFYFQKSKNLFLIIDIIFVILITFFDRQINISLLTLIIPLSIMFIKEKKKFYIPIIIIISCSILLLLLLNVVNYSHLSVTDVFGIIFALFISFRIHNAICKTIPKEEETIPKEEEKKESNLEGGFNIDIKQLNLIKELRNTVSSSSSIYEALSNFLERLRETFTAKACSIRLIEESGGLSGIIAQSGLSKDYVSKGEIDLNRSELNREVLLGGLVHVLDISTSPLIQYSKELEKEGIKSIIGIPVFAKNNEVIGILKLYFSSAREKVSEEIEELLLGISGEIGLLIQNDLALKKIKELDREKSLFLITTAHQLRSPVSGLQSLLKIIFDGYVGEINPKQKELIHRAIKRTDYMLNLISDLISLASSELQIKKEYKKIPLGELVSEVVDSLRERIFEKSIVFTFDKLKRELYIYGNEDDLRKAIENIIENAVKYTKENGKVEVIIGKKQKFATVTVSDNGIGIPKESLPNLFHDFYRSPNAKEFAEHGTGLGLSIVKRIVQEHKGKIFLASDVRMGTTIKLFFPTFEGSISS